MLVPTMVALGYYTTTITANGLVSATINGQTYTSTLPPTWSLSIENGNQTRVGASGAASRLANQGGENKVGGSGHVTVGYTVVDSRTINSSDRVVFNYTRNLFVSATLSNYTETVESASSGIADEALEISRQIGVGTQDHSTTLAKKSSLVSSGSDWTPVTGGKSGTYQVTFYEIYSARAENHSPSSGNLTVSVAQGDTAVRIVPGTVQILSTDYLSMYVPSFVKSVSYQVMQGVDLLVDSGQDGLVYGAMTVPMVGLAEGDYDIYIRAPRSLRRKVSVHFVPGSSPSYRPWVLYFGDIDGDNSVTQDEVNFVYSQIGASDATDAWYTDCGDPHGWLPVQADMNGDGQVTIADYNLVSGNVGMDGN